MPRAADGGYSPNASGAGTAAGQPSLWGGSGGGGDAATGSYASPDVPKPAPYTATGGSAKPDIPQLHADGTYTSDASMPSMATAPAPPAPPAPSTTDVGSFSADLSSPLGLAESLKKDQKQANNIFDGLGSALFGPGSLLGGPAAAVGQTVGGVVRNTPILNAVAGVAAPVSDAITNVASGPINDVVATARGGLDVASGAAEHIPVGAIPPIFGGGPQAQLQVDQQFAAVPDSPEKQAVQAQIASDPLAGDHLKSAFVRQYVQQQQSVNPDLYPELKTAPGSLGDTVVSLLGGLSSFSRPFERAIAGAGKHDGLNRLQAIEAVAEGRTYADGPNSQSSAIGSVDFAGGKKGLSDVEEIAYKKWKDGTWSSDQALTFLAASSSGFSHDPTLEIAGQVALDPTVWGSVGAAGLSKLGIAGLRLAELPAGEALRVAGTSNKVNILGKLAESQKVSGVVRAIGGHVYTPIENNMLGQAAKVVRTIIDPLHAIGGHGVVQTAAVDVASESAARVMSSAYGELASKQVASDMNRLGLLQDLADAAATYSGNKVRSMLVRQHVQGLIDHNLAGSLVGSTPADVVEQLTHNAPADWADLLKQDMVSVAKRDWSGDAVSNLGERMAAFFGKQSPGEWAKSLAGKSADYLGHLHADTYGAATKQFLRAIGDSTNILGVADALAAKLPRLILLNRETLTHVGAQGILDDIKGAKSLEEAVQFIEVAKKQYPELGFVSIDRANLETSVQKFVTRVEHQIEDGVLPSQLLDREIAKLPQPLQDLYAKMAGAFDFGFRPEDDKLFGLGYDGEGQWAMTHEPWVDHVATSTPGFRGIQGLRYNAAGMPLIGEPIGKVLDYIDAGARTLTARVNTATITEAAKARFAADAAKRVPGLASQDARKIFDAVSEAAGLHETTARGLSSKNMWDAVKPLVPDHLRLSGEMTPRDLMTMIVHAYEGDLRFVGLTQKFTGKAKTLFANATGSNFAGQMSENLYQKIKFAANPVFQAQERIEPWVLNAMRGSDPAFGTKLTEVDRMALQEARNLRDSGVIRATDVDQAEFSSYGKLGNDMAGELARKDPSFWGQLTNTKGAKRVNEIRTYQHNMGDAFRRIWEQHQPGLWDRVVAHYSGSQGALISDAEAATRYVAEQGLAGDVTIHSVIRPGADAKAFQNAIGMAEWYRPNGLGEIRGLNLDFMARVMGWTTLDGKTIDSVGDLRAALADHGSGITMDRVGDTLRSFGAHEDYIRRVTNALDFHWDGFWRTVAKRFNLQPAQTQRLQHLMSDSARVRGMTPVDYMSQVVSPMIGGGSSALVESLDSAVSVLRAGKGATSEDLAMQLADVFRHHLDPSGQAALMESFKNNLPTEINASMQRGAKVTSTNLQGTLSQFRGGDAQAGGAVLPTHALSPEGFQRGRFASQTEIDQLTEQGKTILADKLNAASSPILQDPGSYDAMAQGMFDRVQPKWGGATFDPHTGQFLEHEPFVYHGTSAKNAPSIAATGFNRGSFTNDLASVAKSTTNADTLYRTKPGSLVGGSRRYGDLSQIDNPRVAAANLEVSTDGGKSWAPVDRANPPGGPYFSATGHQGDMPIADAADPAKFRQALDGFMADHRAELEKADHYVGIFRNEDTGLVEFDVSIAVKSEREAEAVQLAAPQYQTGGAYNLYGGPDAPGVFSPVNRGDWLAAHSQAFGQSIIDRMHEVRGMAPAAVKATAKSPDVERAVQQFAKWSKQVLGGGFLGDEPRGAQLLHDLAGIPTDAATPANHMHAMLVNQVTQAQRMASEDAFRLTYFARNRTFLERSLNHPFFGIYPASYMWGKIAPEMARFMAREPFGLRTGVAMKAANDFAVSVAVQREMDPEFQAHMDKLGNSAVGWFLGYMLPSLPWDVGSAAPSWVRDIATQGLANQQRVDAGQAPKPIDLAHAFTKIGDYINPLRPATQIERPLGELGDMLNGGSKADKKAAATASKKDAARQTKLEKDVSLATVAVETAQDRLTKAKTVAGKRTAQKNLDQANYILQIAHNSLRDAYPDSEKNNVQPNQAEAAPGAATDLQSTLSSAASDLSSILFGH